jgi:hypothetical protein
MHRCPTLDRAPERGGFDKRESIVERSIQHGEFTNLPWARSLNAYIYITQPT